MQIEANQSYVPERELNTSTPRHFRLTRTAHFFRAAGLTLWIILSLVLFYNAYQHISTVQRLLKTGKVTNARITNKRAVDGKTTAYFLDYDYMVDKEFYYDNVCVSRYQYEDAGYGAPLVITYLPSDPSINRTGTVTVGLVQEIQRNWALVITGFFVVYGLLFAAGEQDFKKDLYLAQYGTAVQARIVHKDQQTVKTTTSSLRYSFAVGGKEIQRTVLVLTADYENVDLGDCITVLYAPQAPNKNMPYLTMKNVEVAPRLN